MFLYTKSEIKNLHADRLDELLVYVGGSAHLAAMLSVPRSTANSWKAVGRISVEGVHIINDHPNLSQTKFKGNYLRPELEF